MLEITNTENLAGIKIKGDYQDLLSLERAILDMSGQGAYESYRDIERNLADLVLEIRANNTDDGKYHEVKVLWPDIIFDVLAISDFMNLTSGKTSYLNAQENTSVKERLTKEIFYLRYFTGLVLNAYSKFVKVQSYTAFYKIAHSPKMIFNDYYASYLNVLRGTFLKQEPTKRAAFIEVLPFMIVSKNETYQKYVQRVKEVGYERSDTSSKEEIQW